MTNNRLLKVEELRLEKGEYVLKSCLINPSKIISVLSGALTKQGPHLLGEERERELRLITLEGGHKVFTEKTIDEIDEMIGQ